MLLSTLLLAAAAPVDPPRAVGAHALPVVKRGCPGGETTFTLEKKERVDPLRPLAREPRPKGRYAVLRTIDGCAVDAPMKASR